MAMSTNHRIPRAPAQNPAPVGRGTPSRASPGDGAAVPYQRNQMTAMKLGRRLGAWIASEHPGVADEYRAGRSYAAEIASAIPGLLKNARSSRITTGAVGYAVRALIGPQELHRLASAHRLASLERTVGGFGTAAGRAFSSRAGRRNVEVSNAARNPPSGSWC